MNDLPVALLKNGKEHSKVIPSTIYQPIRASSLEDGQNHIVVIDGPVSATNGDLHALKFSSGLTVPSDIQSCRVGVEGWELCVRVWPGETKEARAEAD